MFDRKDKTYDKNSLQTPQYLVDWLDCIYSFHIDLAASADNALFNQYFTKGCDALSQNWMYTGYKLDGLVSRHTGFLNPPYGRGLMEPFIIKAIHEASNRFTTVMVIPELNGEFRTRLIMEHATNIYHFDKRISFLHPITKKPLTDNNRGTIVVEFSHKYVKTPPNHIFKDLKKIKEEYS